MEEVNYRMTRLQSWYKLPQFQENGPKEMGTNQPWNWRLIVPKPIKMALLWSPMTSFKMTVRAVLFLHGAPSLCLWKLSPLTVGRGGSQPLDRSLPSPLTASIQNEQIFLSTNLASLMAFEWWAARLPLSVTHPPTFSTSIYWVSTMRQALWV